MRPLTQLAFPDRGVPMEVEGFDVPRPAQGPGLIAGAGRQDITPPPGFPTGGHSIAGNLSRGYWSRLYARAFFFQDAEGHSLVLASCDLVAIPGGLHARVAQLVANRWGDKGVSIPPDSIVLSATHTHHGPGNFWTALAYNEHASFYPGFSTELFEFLAQRIAAAIALAVEDARAHPPPELILRSGSAPRALQLNRSPRTFLLNWNRHAIATQLNGSPPSAQACAALRSAGEVDQDWDAEDCARLWAVDRTMNLLEIRRADGPAGVLVFFAVHATVLVPRAPLYSPDFVGRATGLLERKWARGSGQPVVAFFNGAEGDIVPRRIRRDLRDVVRMGDELTRAIEALREGTPGAEVAGAVTARRAVVHTSQAKDRECSASASSPPERLAPEPLVGAAALGGSEWDRTIFYGLGFREGVRDRALDGQGGKRGALDLQVLRAIKLSKQLAPPDSFPETLPVSYATVGSFTLVAFPTEMSTAQWFEIRERLQLRRETSALIGLANEYIGYTATPDEYAAQDYMAAQTIWGPREGPFMGCVAERLRSSASSGSEYKIPAVIFRPGPGPEEEFGPSFVGERRQAPDEELEMVCTNARGSPERQLPFFEWEELLAADATDFEVTRSRKVSVMRADGTAVDDDRIGGMITLLREAPREDRDPRHWAAIWVTPLWQAPPRDAQFVFKVDVPGEKKPICSAPFSVDLSVERMPRAIPPGNCPSSKLAQVR